MFTDIVGYTKMMQNDEALAFKIRTRHREVFEQQHQVFQGEIVQYFGDGTLSIFSSAVEAVQCAIKIQKILSDNQPVVPVRIGLHLGDIVYNQTEVYGDGVNVAARIENISTAGSILLSEKINDELKNHKEVSTISLGSFEFKNVANPVEIFAISNQGLKLPIASELKGKRTSHTKSIAVLPFVNMSSNQENEFFSDGMTEEIINALTKIKGLRVTSRTSSFFFKGRNLPVSEIGKELNVSTILEGSIRLAGKKMRITVQLIDVTDDYHFWSETFDRPVEDVFAVQDEISLLIADRLREHLGHLEIDEHLVKDQEIPFDTYLSYLKSRYLMLKMSKSEIDAGISILQPVISKYPEYPLAYLGVHLGYTLLGTLGLMPAMEAFATGQKFLDRAIELDENLPECQLHLSWICFLQKWDLECTYHHLNRVLEIRPMVDYYQTMTSVVMVERKYKAASNYIDTAIQLDPFSDINYHLKGFIMYCQEKYEEAIEFFQKSVSLKSGSQVSLLYWGQTLLLLNRNEDALHFFQNLDDETDLLIKEGGIALSLIAAGQPEKAKPGIEVLENALDSDKLEKALLMLILCKTMEGKLQEAIQLVEKGLSYRLPLLVYLRIEPMVKPLWSIPEFENLMQQIFPTLTNLKHTTRKYKKSLLDKNLLDQYRNHLHQLMAGEKLFLNPDLTLRDLADRMNLSANQLSQLLNEGFNQNFSEFVNSHRLDTFKLKAADPKKRNLTILALAYESGFNSKTVFNTYFKKHTGQTPKEYWKSLS